MTHNSAAKYLTPAQAAHMGRVSQKIQALQRMAQALTGRPYKETDMTAKVTYAGFLDMQVCVPEGWNDNQVLDFANSENPSGTTSGWQIRRAGDEALGDCDERVCCEDRPGHVHMMLDA